MTLFRFLLGSSRPLLAFVLATAVVGGACNAGLIATLNHALHAGAVDRMALVFLLLAAGRIAASLMSQLALSRFSHEAIARLRKDLIEKILKVPLADLERIGAHRLNASLSDDAMNITAGLVGLPHMIVNVGLLAFGGLYLAWLSWNVVLAMGAFIAVGAIAHRYLVASGMRFLRLAREDQDRLFGHFRALTEGMKELKLHRRRRAEFLDACVEPATQSCRRNNCAAEDRFIVSTNFTTLLFLGMVGALVFAVPRIHPLDKETLSAFVLTCPFLMGPLAAVLGSFTYVGRASVALDRVQSLGATLGTHRQEREIVEIGTADPTFERVELMGVTHTYRSESEDRPFRLGPIHLSLRRGELVFLVGGNGSGKSTLAKLLTGLYTPEAGLVRLDGRVITESGRDRYRQCFSAVFGDFYLFDDLLGLDGPDHDERTRSYLTKLRLDRKVTVDGGRLSTTALSAGQRKRLALLVSYLEDRPVYVFDEWAADQDPEFREFFYTVLLPELRARHKAVFVITHDDRWFHVADRVLKLDSGKIVEEFDTSKMTQYF